MSVGDTVLNSPTLAYFKRAGSPIVAIATAMGGPVVILRISGRELKTFEACVGPLPSPGHHELRAIRAPGSKELLDRALVLRFQAPHSFTGEDIIEIHAHGVASVLERIIEELVKLGAERALPGEFSFRAVLNEKMSLSEAEALNTSLGSESLGQSWASSLLTVAKSSEQRVQERLDRALTKLEEARGRVEASIDFSEAETEQADDVRSADERINEVKSTLAELITSFENFSRASGEIKVAIVGEPNVGKSTLLNRLLGGEKALVSPLAGTTRDVVEGSMRLPSGRRVRLLDTAGVREIRSEESIGNLEIERRGIERGLESARGADVLMILRKASDADNRLRELHPDLFVNQKVVELRSFGDEASDRGLNYFDLRDQKNQVEAFVARALDEALNIEPVSGEIEVLISQRQYRHLQRARDAIHRAQSALVGDAPIELCGEELREAESELKSALGREVGEGYIEAIFRQFCLGK